MVINERKLHNTAMKRLKTNLYTFNIEINAKRFQNSNPIS